MGGEGIYRVYLYIIQVGKLFKLGVVHRSQCFYQSCDHFNTVREVEQQKNVLTSKFLFIQKGTIINVINLVSTYMHEHIKYRI